MALVVLHPKQEHDAEGGPQAQDAGEHAGGRQVEAHLGTGGRRGAQAYLSPVQLAQHYHRECKHDNVASKHFPNVKEDCLETDVVEASSSEDEDLEVVVAIHFCAVVNQKLFKI